MRIAVLGTGGVGRTLAERLDELGHHVTLGTRDPARTRESDAGAWLSEHPGVRLAPFGEAASGAELLLLAVAGTHALATLDQAGAEHLAGKVLLDLTNPLDFSHGMPPTLFVKDEDSLGERIQRAVPDARVVKTLNTMTGRLMAHPEELPEPTSVFVSGNDAEAKATVTGLLHSLGHRDVIDLGGIATARGPEMWLPLWLRVMDALETGTFNLRIVR